MVTLSELCGRVDSQRLAEASVDRIRRELPTYRTISVEEHRVAVARQQGNQLVAMAESRVVGGEALTEAAALARLRARQNVDIEVLIGAYHLGDQVLWQALVEASDDHTAHLLPRAASLLLASLHALSTALTAAHAEASQALQSRRITASQRLFELLVPGRVGAETRTHAEMLGLDVTATFVAIAVFAPDGLEAALSNRAANQLDRAGGTTVVGGLALDLLLCQGLPADRVCDVLGNLDGPGMMGVGLERTGLRGAAASLGDARRAALVDGDLAATLPAEEPVGATRLTVAAFADVWPEACVLRELPRLEPVLAVAAAVAIRHPHLAQAVVAFARCDMHVARAAKALNLHANSLGYRLDRWAKLTGWDPRTFDGLRRSVAAVVSAGKHGGAVEVLNEP